MIELHEMMIQKIYDDLEVVIQQTNESERLAKKHRRNRVKFLLRLRGNPFVHFIIILGEYRWSWASATKHGAALTINVICRILNIEYLYQPRWNCRSHSTSASIMRFAMCWYKINSGLLSITASCRGKLKPCISSHNFSDHNKVWFQKANILSRHYR